MVPFLLDPLTEAGDGDLLLIPGPGRDASSPNYGPDLSHLGHAYCSILVNVDLNLWQHITHRIIIVVIIYMFQGLYYESYILAAGDCR